jgi:hypothetical protein
VSSVRLLFPLVVSFVAALVLSALAACGYEERNFDEIAFACNAQRPCPDGRACIGGRCALGDGSGSNAGQLGIRCGGTTCALGMACCDSVISRYCAPVGSCALGDEQLLCDGKEDCTGGRSCCLDGENNTACVSGNCGGPPNLVCSDAGDCPGGSNCCDLMLNGIKQCLPVSCPF